LFKKNLQNQFEVYRLEVVNKDAFNPSNGNLRLYSKIKIEFGHEPYLKIIKNVKQRVAVTKMRISSQSLPIETGRYRKIAKDERICPFCESSIGGDFHSSFLILGLPVFLK